MDIWDNQIYINQSDTPLDEPYLPEPMDSENYHFQVPEGCYLMLGDNRNHSRDARDWSDPFVVRRSHNCQGIIPLFSRNTLDFLTLITDTDNEKYVTDKYY